MEWKEVRLGDVCDLIAGFAFKAKDFGEFPTKVIKIGDIKPPFVDYVGQVGVDISNYDINRLSKYTVKYGDYVLAMTGATIGKVGKYISKNFSYINQRVLKFSPKQNVDADFINYIICSNIFAKYVVNYVDSESAQPNISAPTISKFAFQIPSEKDDQRRIASILSSLDRKIELNNKINADLEEMAQAIFKNWFVDFEPFKDGKFVDSELGMIPEGWKVGALGDFCNVFTGKKNTNQAIEKGLYPFFSCAPEPLASNDAIFNGKAIIIAGNGSYTGRTMFYNGGFDLYQRTYACTIREQDEENLMIFFYHMMKQFFEPVKMGGTRGSSIPYIVMGDITQQKFPYSEERLIRFSNIANSMMDRKLRIDKENSRLSLLRDTLLPRLMSGELEVPE